MTKTSNHETERMTLWKDNKVSGEYEASIKEIADGFLASTYAAAYRDGLPLTRALGSYISAPDGLSSVWEDQQAFDRVVDLISGRSS